MFDFKNSISQGLASAGKVQSNIIEINTVFEALNKDLHDSFNPRLSVERNIDEGLKILRMLSSASTPTIPQNDKGPLLICWSGEKKLSEAIATWEQNPDGYPFTIQFLNQRIDCWDQGALVDALNKIVSSGQFWLKADELKSRSKNQLI